MKNLGRPVLLGRDFIKHAAIRTDGYSQSFFVGVRDGLVATSPQTSHALRRVAAYCPSRLTIPAKSTILVVSPILPTLYDGLVGNITPERCGSVSAVGLTTMVRNGAIPIPITNDSAKPVEVSEGTAIGYFEETAAKELPGRAFEGNTVEVACGSGSMKFGDCLSAQERSGLVHILQSHLPCLAFDGSLGECSVICHEINTSTTRPISAVPYRQSPATARIVQKQVAEWLAIGVIRPSCSPWASPVVVVPKKDGSMRLCVDYRRLNRETVRDAYPLPHLEDTLAALNGANYYSSLDLNQGYLQIQVSPSDTPKTAFIIPGGFYEFTRMPFGLTNAPATFQRCMDTVLADLKYKCCLVYLDDIIIFGRSLEEHNDNLAAVLERIEQAHLTIKPSKCVFGVNRIRFLGHIVGTDGLEVDPDKVTAVQALPPPTNVKEVQSFIGLASYYRRFIDGFAKAAEPLTRLTKKDRPFIWEREQELAFAALKERLSMSPVLCHYDPQIPMEVRTDACGYGIGAILLHAFPDGAKRPICYASRLLAPAERNYSISEQEGLAIVWAVQKFKTYLQGVQFTVVTDHIALAWLREKRNLHGRLMELEAFDYRVVYKNGSSHKDADHLSRFPNVAGGVTAGRRGTFQRKTRLATPTSLQPEEPTPREDVPISLEVLRELQLDDCYCQAMEADADRRDFFAVRDGLLMTRPDESKESTWRIVVPDVAFDRLMRPLHDEPVAGHLGYNKTLQKFRQRYFLPNAAKRVKQYVKSCHLCQIRKPAWTRQVGALESLPPKGRPFERIGLDTIGPLRATAAGHTTLADKFLSTL